LLTQIRGRQQKPALLFSADGQFLPCRAVGAQKIYQYIQLVILRPVAEMLAWRLRWVARAHCPCVQKCVAPRTETNPMLSINTNSSAMLALQYLTKTGAQISDTETAVSTGLKVADARDDGATYAIAQNMRGDIAGCSSIQDSLNRGLSVLDVALSAGQSISDLMIEMKQKALAAADTALDTASRKALNDEFTALAAQIGTVVKNAAFNGLNMIDGTTQMMTALASTDGTRRITVGAQNFSFGGGVLGAAFTKGITISTTPSASHMVAVVTAALKGIDSALSKLAAGAKKFSIQLGFTQKLSDSLTTGVGNLVDADMAKESANLTALQTKQQLGVQALSIANATPNIILSLFQ
jgi:flagellin